MIEVRYNVLGDKTSWTVSPPPIEGVVEDVVRLTFSTGGFASLSERDAYEIIRSSLRRENVTWVQPGLNAWRFDLAGLSALIGGSNAISWLRGTVSVKPEFKYRTIPVGIPSVSTGTFVFYISADMTSETPKMENS